MSEKHGEMNEKEFAAFTAESAQAVNDEIERQEQAARMAEVTEESLAEKDASQAEAENLRAGLREGRVTERREGSAAEIGAAQRAAMELVIQHIEAGGISQSYEFAFRNPAVFFDSISARQFDSLPDHVRAEVQAAVEEGVTLLQKEYGEDLDAYFGGEAPTGFERTGRTLHRVQDLVRRSRFLRINRSELVPIAQKLADAFDVAWNQAMDQKWPETSRAEYYAGNATAATRMIGREALSHDEEENPWMGWPLEEPGVDAPLREKAGYELERVRRGMETIGSDHELRLFQDASEDLRVITRIFQDAEYQGGDLSIRMASESIGTAARELGLFDENYRNGYSGFGQEIGDLMSGSISEAQDAIAARMYAVEEQQRDFLRVSRRLEDALSDVLRANKEQLGHLDAGDSAVLARRIMERLPGISQRLEERKMVLEGVRNKFEFFSSQQEAEDFEDSKNR